MRSVDFCIELRFKVVDMSLTARMEAFAPTGLRTDTDPMYLTAKHDAFNAPVGTAH